MKYKVNAQGIESLNSLQNSLKGSLQELAGYGLALQQEIDSNEQGAGPHHAEIQALVLEISDITVKISEPIEEICESLNDLAESYEEIIDHKLGHAAVNTFAAVGAVSQSSGSGSSASGYSVGQLQEILDSQGLGEQYTMMDPADIDMSTALGMDSDSFWNHHGNSKERYGDLMGKIGKFYDAMAKGEKISDMKAFDYPDRDIQTVANIFFTKGNDITVEQEPDGKIYFDGDGRHRIALAKELGILIPVRITNRK